MERIITHAAGAILYDARFNAQFIWQTGEFDSIVQVIPGTLTLMFRPEHGIDENESSFQITPRQMAGVGPPGCFATVIHVTDIQKTIMLIENPNQGAPSRNSFDIAVFRRIFP
jgi:hypothetical protein